MKSLGQKGFTHTAIVGAVVVLAAIGGTGYFVINKNKSKSTSISSSNTATDSSVSEVNDEQAVKAAAKAHFALVYQKKLEEAYKSTCQDFQDLTTYEKFNEFVGSLGFQTVDLSATAYTSVDVRNNQAKISGTVGPLYPDSNLEVNLLKKSIQVFNTGNF